jgi:hypothetical protein
MCVSNGGCEDHVREVVSRDFHLTFDLHLTRGGESREGAVNPQRKPLSADASQDTTGVLQWEKTVGG